jgi:uncharacterized SAM-binding protein YcdF (DUF218 family)
LTANSPASAIEGPESGPSPGRVMAMAAHRPQLAARGRAPIRRAAMLALAAVGCGALLAAGGFAAFIAALDRKEPAVSENSDAVIVLTGGPERIEEAVEHLAAGRASRLLISGVHSATTPQKLLEIVPALKPHMRCCIDLGHDAENTVGNAAEARRWMKRKGFRSALVVTSNYHMPRAMLEFRRHMPGVKLTPAPVVTRHLRLRGLWRDPQLVKLLAIEYAKFGVASLRAGLTPPPRMEDIAGLPGRRGS